MGLFDNIIQRVANEIAKAAPAPTVTPVTEAQLQAVQNTGYGNSAGLTRNPMWSSVPFGSGQPIIPGAINPVRADGRPDPRRYEYQVAQNINITPTRLVPFSTLRAAGDQIDILRRCIEVLKNKMVGLEWDIVLGEDAAEKVMAETGEKSYTRAMALAKNKFMEEIDRLKQFWEVPDVSNGLIFSDWLNMALEDILVLDAWAVWPQKTVGGDLKGLQLLDGATIKPLLDDRGMRPQSPYPAFQQILFGFPRSEFSAPEEDVDADGEFSSDELAYMVRNRRTNTTYGYSPVERALPVADIYLRAQQFLRAEYTDGVIPELILKSDGAFTPDQLRAYENILNDYLSGQTEQRKRANILPQGLDPIAMEGYAEKFKADMHDFLITQICGHFGVLPSEIGMTPKSGLGGSGHQSGQSQSSEVIGLIPLANWVGKMLTQLSYVFLGMPRELEFKFMPSNRQNELELAQTSDLLVKDGTMTRNEARSRMGLPLLDAIEADQPIVETAAGTFLLTDEGLRALNPTGDTTDPDAPAIEPGTGADEPATADEPVVEVPENQDIKNKPVENVKKFNENHDESGRFSSGDGGGASAPASGGAASVKAMESAHEQMSQAIDGLKDIKGEGGSSGRLDQIQEGHIYLGDAQGSLDEAKDALAAGEHGAAWASTKEANDLFQQAVSSFKDGFGGDLGRYAGRVGQFESAMTRATLASVGLGKSADSYVQARDEIRKFKKWLKKSPTKQFNFEHVPASYADTLNKFIAVKDYDGARWFADRWL